MQRPNPGLQKAGGNANPPYSRYEPNSSEDPLNVSKISKILFAIPVQPKFLRAKRAPSTDSS